MFQESLLDGQDSRRPWTFSVSLLSQLLLLSLAVLLPLLGTPMLPTVSRAFVLLEPPKSPRGAPPPKPAAVERPQVFTQEIVQPKTIPDRVELILDEAPVEIVNGPVVVGADPSTAGGGVISSIVTGAPAVQPPPPPPPKAETTPPAAPSGPIPVGGNVQDARILRRVTPIYPPLAKQARISGVVRLKAVIAADGAVDQLEVVSGHPLLIQAALTAVQQWRYRPTLLNGNAVPVLTQIEVRFALR